MGPFLNDQFSFLGSETVGCYWVEAGVVVVVVSVLSLLFHEPPASDVVVDDADDVVEVDVVDGALSFFPNVHDY